MFDSATAWVPGSGTFQQQVFEMHSKMKEVYDGVIERDPDQHEFHQAVEEVLDVPPGCSEVGSGTAEEDPEDAVPPAC